MQEKFEVDFETFNSQNIQIYDQHLSVALHDYKFFYISEDKHNILQNEEIKSNFHKSTIIIVDYYKDLLENITNIFFIIGFKDTIIVLNENSFSILKEFLKSKQNLSICFLKDCKTYFDHKNQEYIRYTEVISSDNFDSEIYSFNSRLSLKKTQKNHVWKIVRSCISGYLIKEAYSKIYDRQSNILTSGNFNSSSNIDNSSLEYWNEDEYFELRILGSGISHVFLVYHIERNELFAIKKINQYDIEYSKLINREFNNYLEINYPLLPKLIAKVKQKDYLIITFINGQTLLNEKLKLTENDKIKIIFELMMIINYLHQKGFVYRDLKPDNVIIDENKNIFLIDFDRMIKFSDTTNNEDRTLDLKSDFLAPELHLGQISFKNDIYSIGKMINYIMYEILPKNEKQSNIISIYEQCINDHEKQRPSITEIMFGFYSIFRSDIDNLFLKIVHEIQYYHSILFLEDKFIKQDVKKSIHLLTFAANLNISQAQFNLGIIYCLGQYVTQNVNKAIDYFLLAASQNHVKSQFNLGNIYYEGIYIKRDINKAIHYLTLAADQNFTIAQYNLGKIYYEGKFIAQNINKAIHYYSLAADQNFQRAQFNLGIIYLNGPNNTRDINKAIHYLTLAANQNSPKAQFILGEIYFNGQDIERDINKAIHYFTLASNQNIPQANFSLGVIYSDEQYFVHDINKAIYYYSLASNGNIPEAQFNLAKIYFEGQYVTLDINKAIHYYTLSANQNFVQAQVNLGIIYYDGQYITRDINKSIYYFTLAANQNNPDAQFNLGNIFYDGKYITQDINKSVYYFTLAAHQNHVLAQYNLGFIFSEGKYITNNINKSIYYYSLASNQNFSEAQFNLGGIYYLGQYITQDINKAIHYFKLAAIQNHAKSQFILGNIYYEDKYIKRDINKAIYYYSLAANQNYSAAQFNLGVIYQDGLYITRDIDKAIYYYSKTSDQNYAQAQFCLSNIYLNKKCIKKAIHYLTLAADQNFPEAQFNLGLIYFEGKYIPQDVKKGIHYYSLAANHNYARAQFNLGVIYYEGLFITKDVNKAIYYYSLAANQNYSYAQFNLGYYYLTTKNLDKKIDRGVKLVIQSLMNGNIKANFAVGYLYHQGKYIKQDIKKSIHCYKEASSFNNQYAKNNLGIIYKVGFDDEIHQNTGKAMIYFDEAIRQKQDEVSMYNLSHIYFFDDKTSEGIDKSIELLTKVSIKTFSAPFFLLCLAIIKKHGTDFLKIKHELEEKTKTSSDLPKKICKMIKNMQLFNEYFYNMLYECLKTTIYLYDFELNVISYESFINQKNQTKNSRINDITPEFYEGFGHDI